MSTLCVSPPQAAGELLSRQNARMRVLNFTTYTMPSYRVWWHHKLIAEYLDKWVSGEIKRLMVFCPPQVGKSELVSRRLPAFMFGKNPNLKLLSCEHSATLAESMNRDVQRIMDDTAYRKVFPEVKVPTAKDSTYRRTLDYFEIVGHSGSLRSAGVRMKIAGHPAHAGIIDDPFGSQADADSPTIRNSVWEWYTGDFYSRLSKDAPVLITHTRWNRDDLAGRLLVQMADESADQWTILTLPAMHTGTATHSGDPRGPGEALWPAHKSAQDLESIRKQNPRVFAAQYQQDPQASGSEFPPAWFGPEIWFDEWPERGQRIITLDPSKGVGSRWGDYSAFVSLCYEAGTLYIDADMRNDRNMATIIETAVELQKEWKSEAFGIEADQFQELIGDDVFALAKRRGVLFPLWKITTEGVNKNVRIRRLTPWLSKGIMRFKGGSPGAQLLVQQLQDFPNGEHDDGPDALEMALRLLVNMGNKIDDGLGNALRLNVP